MVLIKTCIYHKPFILFCNVAGVVNHARNVKMYHTFLNVKTNVNSSIDCLLKALAAVVLEEGKLPDVEYYQVDGGSENTADHALGIIALIVTKKLAKKLIISRLPVGHTHENIDLKFAFIWKRVRDLFELTQVNYLEHTQIVLDLTSHICRNAVEGCLRNNRVNCEVVDLFVVPNYEKYIRSCIIPDFGRYAKLRRNGYDWTQLQ